MPSSPPSKLKLYLFLNNISLIDFSRKLEMSSAHISNVSFGKTRASKKLARHIERATNGAVTAQDVMNFYNEKYDEKLEKIV